MSDHPDAENGGRNVPLPRKESPPKHLPYFRLTEACREKECPICFQVKKWVADFLDGLLYERVNDRAFRARFREDGGFCNYHSYLFASYRDGLAVALTHRDLLGDRIQELTRSRKPALSRERGCIVCGDSRKAEGRYVDTLAEYADDPEFRQAFQSSAGLCLPHYAMLRRKMRSLPGWLAGFQESQYRGLLELLDRFLDGSNFSRGQAGPELSPEEQLVWKKAVGVIHGYEGRIRPSPL